MKRSDFDCLFTSKKLEKKSKKEKKEKKEKETLSE
jgi:hypothetical protein